MKSIHIRAVPDETVDRLKRLAKSHHRSLQGELQHILERASNLAPKDEQGIRLNLVTVNSGVNTTWSREAIYDSDGR